MEQITGHHSKGRPLALAQSIGLGSKREEVTSTLAYSSTKLIMTIKRYLRSFAGLLGSYPYQKILDYSKEHCSNKHYSLLKCRINYNYKKICVTACVTPLYG